MYLIPLLSFETKYPRHYLLHSQQQTLIKLSTMKKIDKDEWFEIGSDGLITLIWIGLILWLLKQHFLTKTNVTINVDTLIVILPIDHNHIHLLSLGM